MHTLWRAVLVLLFAGAAAPVQAQWLKYPTPGLPRTAHGTPDLSAPAPRTTDGKPDLSGVWGMDAGPSLFYIPGDLNPEQIKPWARDLVRQRSEHLQRDDPGVRCLPEGPRFNHFVALPKKIVQTPKLIVVLSEDLSYRQIFLDGRPLPDDPSPSFMGYSVGRWEGDTLVVETIGYKDTTWLDWAGHPHTEGLRLTERYRRLDYGRLEIEETFHDPHVYGRPLSVRVKATLVADTDLLEYVCAENEKSRDRLIGTLSEVHKSVTPVAVPASVLEQYVGAYDFRFPENPTIPSIMSVTLTGDTLRLGGAPLVPISETRFLFGSNPIEFARDKHGRTTHFVVTVVEGDIAARKLPETR